MPHLLLHVELGQQVGSSLWVRLRVDLTLIVVVDVFDVADPRVDQTLYCTSPHNHATVSSGDCKYCLLEEMYFQ